MPSRILIADDHDAIRRMLKAALEGHPDWEVCAEAKDGLEVVRLTLELLPDIVILDFAMPGMDGVRATQNILSVLHAIPILLYTSHASSTLVSEAVHAGAQQVISKSVPIERLIEAVEVALNPKAAEAADRSEPERSPGTGSACQEDPRTQESSQSSNSRRRCQTASSSHE